MVCSGKYDQNSPICGMCARIQNVSRGTNSAWDFDYELCRKKSTIAAKEVEDISAFKRDLAACINKHSAENGSDTPDFILAEYLYNCLQHYNTCVEEVNKWRNPQKEWQQDEHIILR